MRRALNTVEDLRPGGKRRPKWFDNPSLMPNWMKEYLLSMGYKRSFWEKDQWPSQVGKKYDFAKSDAFIAEWRKKYNITVPTRTKKSIKTSKPKKK